MLLLRVWYSASAEAFGPAPVVAGGPAAGVLAGWAVGSSAPCSPERRSTRMSRSFGVMSPFTPEDDTSLDLPQTADSDTKRRPDQGRQRREGRRKQSHQVQAPPR